MTVVNDGPHSPMVVDDFKVVENDGGGGQHIDGGHDPGTV